MKIINLTQHAATPEQVEAGVFDVTGDALIILKRRLTFDVLPTRENILHAAIALAYMAATNGATHAMIGGAPYLMAPLETTLKEIGVTPLYAFSVRESVEETLPDGSVRKTNVFKHGGFVHG